MFQFLSHFYKDQLSTRLNPTIRHLESRPSSNLGREKWVWVRKEQITNETYRSLDKRTPVMRRFDNLDLANHLIFKIDLLNNTLVRSVIDIRREIVPFREPVHQCEWWTPSWSPAVTQMERAVARNCFSLVPLFSSCLSGKFLESDCQVGTQWRGKVG